jgi:hypothetical protein
MQHKTILALAIVSIAIVLSLIIVYQMYGIKNYSQPPTVTPSPIPTSIPTLSTTETPTPTAVQTPQENLVYKAVNMRANYTFTIIVSCNSEQDITLVQAIIKDGHGATIGTSDFNITAPAGGEQTTIPLKLDTPVSIQSEPLTVTLVTKNGNTFMSPEIYQPSLASNPFYNDN